MFAFFQANVLGFKSRQSENVASGAETFVRFVANFRAAYSLAIGKTATPGSCLRAPKVLLINALGILLKK